MTSEKWIAPTSAIVLYEPVSARGYAAGVQSAVYATVHDVTVQNGLPQLGRGVAVAKDGLMALFRGLDPERMEVAKITPTRVLTQGSRWMVWYCPPGRRRVWFKAKGLGERSGEVPLPGLLFAIGPDAWYVFALKSGRRPGQSTKLYQSPFYNVWADGRICTGSMQQPTEAARHDPQAWEKAFFESYFSHPNIHQGPLVRYRGGGTAFWKAMLDGKKFEKFPADVLVDNGMTVEKLLRAINRSLHRE